jgi:hypothetical protein
MGTLESQGTLLQAYRRKELHREAANKTSTCPTTVEADDEITEVGETGGLHDT